jgi:alpha-1,3-rhamnosyltransferase
MNPKVSICIPSYNHARFLPAAIESALAQTYRNIEIIIVDDGSSDGSLEIAQSYATKFPNLISVYTHPNHSNRGISATINRACQESNGDYWTLLGSDDVYHAEKTAQQVSFLFENSTYGWVYSAALIIDERGQILSAMNRIDVSGDLRLLESLILSNQITAITVMARRKCLEALGEHSEQLVYSDWEFWIRMGAHYKLGFIANPLVKYRVHSYNTSLAIDRGSHLKRCLDVLNSIRTNASRYGGQLISPRIRALIELRRAHFLFYLGEKEAAAESLNSVFVTCPSILQESSTFSRWLTVTYESPSLYKWMSEHLPKDLESSFKKRTNRLLIGLTYARAARESYQNGDLRGARYLAIRAQMTDQRWLSDRALLSLLCETMVGSTAMKIARELGRRTLPKYR